MPNTLMKARLIWSSCLKQNHNGQATPGRTPCEGVLMISDGSLILFLQRMHCGLVGFKLLSGCG